MGTAQIPADKSITHRAFLFSALSSGTSVVTAREPGEDNLNTLELIRALGAQVSLEGDRFEIDSPGYSGFRQPSSPLECGNSGTTMRLVAGVLAGAGLASELVGDASLSNRPMKRICEPLRKLGAQIQGRDNAGRETAPLHIQGSGFRGGEHSLTIASAQVKSALLLAGITSGRAVTVTEPALSRDHTERMLEAMGAVLTRQTGEGGSHRVALEAGATLTSQDFSVPGDISSAAFLLAAGSLVDGSRIELPNVGLNGTRTGILEVLEELGAIVEVTAWREEGGEAVGTLTVESADLVAERPGGVATVVGGPLIPRIIDELVVAGALAARATGITEIRDAAELRVKESDRVEETVRLLSAFGVRAESRPDGFTVKGPQPLRAARVDVHSDHRIALTAAVLALAADGDSELRGFEIAEVSFPGFVPLLESLGAEVTLVP